MLAVEAAATPAVTAGRAGPWRRPSERAPRSQRSARLGVERDLGRGGRGRRGGSRPTTRVKSAMSAVHCTRKFRGGGGRPVSMSRRSRHRVPAWRYPTGRCAAVAGPVPLAPDGIMRAVVARATASAPRASALAISSGSGPPVATTCTSSTPCLSSHRRTRCSPVIEGCRRCPSRGGAAPVPPLRPSTVTQSARPRSRRRGRLTCRPQLDADRPASVDPP